MFGFATANKGMLNGLLCSYSSTRNGVQEADAEIVGRMGELVSVGEGNATSGLVLWCSSFLHHWRWCYQLALVLSNAY